MPTGPLDPRRRAVALRSATIAVVSAAAHRIVTARRRLRPGDVQRKAVGDFVTSVDLRCERFLRRELLRLAPDAGFLGEETRATGLDRDFVWVVDPIDGTSNFARGLPHHAVSVALLHRGQPVLACVWCAPEDAIYVAVHRGGAVRNGRRINVPRSRLDDAAIVGCQWHRGQQNLGFLARLQAKGNRIRTFGCTVVQLTDVAIGRLDGNVQEQGRAWDVAAAGLIVEEAGARFTDWFGRRVFPFRSLELGHTPTVAAGARVHTQLLAQLAGASPRVVVPPA